VSKDASEKCRKKRPFRVVQASDPPDGTMSRRLLLWEHNLPETSCRRQFSSRALVGHRTIDGAVLAARGFTVFGTARKPESGKREPFTMLALDVRSDESVRACIEQVITKAGRLDVLVNNAGYAMMGAAEETSVEEAKAQFETNFFGIVRMVNAVLPGMRAAGAGKIINISSLAGNTRFRSAPSTRDQVCRRGYSESLWHEVRPFGISVSLVEPGFVNTRLVRLLRRPSGNSRRTTYPQANAREVWPVPGGWHSARAGRAERAPDRREQGTGLRYRVGAQATWLPRLRNVVPWKVYARGAEDVWV